MKQSAIIYQVSYTISTYERQIIFNRFNTFDIMMYLISELLELIKA